jgi:hypothetical protein
MRVEGTCQFKVVYSDIQRKLISARGVLKTRGIVGFADLLSLMTLVSEKEILTARLFLRLV